MNISNNIILERYIRLALGNITGVISNKKYYNFRCNVCGDGYKKTNKRGHIKYDEKGKFFYFKCFNDGCKASGNGNAWSAERWLKYTSKDLHSQYIREILQPKNDKKNIEKLEKIKFKRVRKKRKKTKLEEFIKLDTSSEDILVQKGIRYCRSRLINKSIWENWYVCKKGKYQNRLIIPFIEDGEMVYFQARALCNQHPKYLNKEEGKDKAIYNYRNLNKDKPVYIFEGIIDSLFIPNSIAILGLSISNKVKKIINKLDTRWILDNDSSGASNSIRLLKKGEYVFLWKEFLKDYKAPSNIKDINQFFMYFSNPENQVKNNKSFLDYFTNSYYDVIKI